MLTLNANPAVAPRRTTLSSDIVLTELAIAQLRRYLRETNLDEWQIFQGSVPYIHGIDNVLERLDPNAVWEAADLALAGEESMIALTLTDAPRPVARAWPSGVLALRGLQVLVARWYWQEEDRGGTRSLFLVAAPRLACVEALAGRLLEINRCSEQPVWQIPGEYGESSRVPRVDPGDSLLLDPDLLARVETDVIGFFAPGVRTMYERLGVPYRRGVLMYGDPGNGKTSLTRRIGARLPNAAALLLRPTQDFNTDTLIETFATWKQLAPALLVIEDLTAVLERVNFSTLLNLLDGVDRKTDGGLMLIASTNHPDKLDPALNNRPGRFDVVIELPSPNAALRALFFGSRLLELEATTVAWLAESTAGLSFAHLEAVVQSSGLAAIRAGRDFRERADVEEALAHVRAAFNTASRGYAKMPEAPFGLAGFRKTQLKQGA